VSARQIFSGGNGISRSKTTESASVAGSFIELSFSAGLTGSHAAERPPYQRASCVI
jgi:hypothetical protein